MDQRAGVARSDEQDRGLAPAFGGDQIRGGDLRDRHVQPGQPAADAPAGFIGHQPRLALHPPHDRVIVGLTPPGRPQHDMAASAPCKLDAKEHLKEAADLALGKAQFLVEHHDRRLGLRPDLAGAAPQGVGGLQFMAPLHAPVAAGAGADMHVELAVHRPARDFHLVLGRHAGLNQRAAAPRTPLRQRSLVHFVDLRRRRAKGHGAVIRAGLAPRLLGSVLGRVREKGAAWRLAERFSRSRAS